MQERLLHFIWQFQYFNRNGLTTTQNENVNIIHPGFANSDAGPDFLNGRIYVGEMLWHGHVEIHLKSSDWLAHNHDEDENYDNVILHVVWEHDREIKRKDGSPIPSIELKHKTRPSLIRRYNELINNPFQIACVNQINQVSQIAKLAMLDKTLMQRLEHKSDAILQMLNMNGGSWEETAYQLAAKNMGFKINSEAFFQLAQSLPARIISKHADRLFQIEALLYGQAGFLNQQLEDEYFGRLKSEYEFLKHKYKLPPGLSKLQWKFLRLRPGNFPTVRLAQFAAILSSASGLFSAIRDCTDFNILGTRFAAEPSPYWQRRYDFGKVSARPLKGMGKAAVENMLINTAAPLLAAYGRATDNQAFMDKAVKLLNDIPAENNRIVRMWKEVGFTVKAAFDSQALIELYNDFCQKKRCVSCNIGVQLLQR